MTHPTTPTLFSAVVKLTALEDGLLPRTSGRLVNGAFLDILRTIDPSLSQQLHDWAGQKPYTVSPLRTRGRAKNGHLHVRAGQPASLRFTLLSDRIFTTLMQSLLSPLQQRPSEGPTLRLGEVAFGLTEFLTTPGSDPWAGYADLPGLQAQAAAAETITVEFASPTAFSLGKKGEAKRMELFPTPGLFFGSLARRWADCLPPELDPDAVQAYAEQAVVVSRYRMESQVYYLWQSPQLGGQGQVTYRLPAGDEPRLARLLNLLVDLGFYSGVGAKTAFGMGQMRRLAA